MSTVAAPKLNFPGPIGTKRRRMRSGGNVSTITNNAPAQASLAPSLEDDDEDDMNDSKAGGKCKGVTTIPIFLKKTYKMIDTCDPSIASWTEDGEMFVVKDPDTFAALVIPQYFDHNKFSSFARQLNFYGFRKMQSKPIRNSDYDVGTAKHVTFFNENFKRGRCDLLKKIQRSTRGGGANSGQDQQREVQNLREQVNDLQEKLQQATEQFEERMRRLELDMLARMEQMMLAMQQQQHTQLQLQTAASVGTNSSSNNSAPNVATHLAASTPMNPTSSQQQGWDPNVQHFPRGSSLQSQINSIASGNNNMRTMDGGFQQPQPVAPKVAVAPPAAPPTLPPHPKQKQFPMGNMFPMNSIGVPNQRLNSLRGISTLSRGLSLNRGASVESSASAVLMRNSWEDKFFSMLMLGEVDPNNINPSQAAALAHPAVDQTNFMNGMGQHQGVMGPPQVSDRSEEKQNNPADDFSSVSDSEMA